jgi:ABC-type phosphate transport system substrate-binding protein
MTVDRKRSIDAPSTRTSTTKELSLMYDVKSRATKLSRVWRRGMLTAAFAVIAAVVSLVALTASPGSAQLATNAAPLSGTGSSFAAPAISTWVNAVRNAPYSLSLSYANSNSGTGRYEFTTRRSTLP